MDDRFKTEKELVNISSSLSNVNFWNAYMEGKMAIYERQLVKENIEGIMFRTSQCFLHLFRKPICQGLQTLSEFSIYPTVLTLCKGLQILSEVWLSSLLLFT
ncbi:uncharacterized protein [Coffea arabica]|uniref:Uncharacterized protein isoform X2 n=1 Tax=Coffea arabica TaxID=13443 RepID=A0A6P6T5Y9_COFAR|nr:uncharacterized protein LOC113698205 isoform X2 [Coffea arabica]